MDKLSGGWLVLYKPRGASSTQALGKAKRLLGLKKAGHGGTLDPLAEGVLPLAFGEATKTMPYILGSDKTYHFALSFGAATTTADTEGEVIAQNPYRPTGAELECALAQFRGEISQTPPAYSALKVDGKRAYELARQGKEVALKPRRVHIHNLILEKFDGETAWLTAKVSKGTYIRSLGEDIAKACDTVGHITTLIRTQAGPFTVEDTTPLEDLEHAPDPTVFLKPVDWPLSDVPTHKLEGEVAITRLKNGHPPPVPGPGLWRVQDGKGTLLALVENEKIVRNFNISASESEKTA